jgi:hypothetical protein
MVNGRISLKMAKYSKRMFYKNLKFKKVQEQKNLKNKNRSQHNSHACVPLTKATYVIPLLVFMFAA